MQNLTINRWRQRYYNSIRLTYYRCEYTCANPNKDRDDITEINYYLDLNSVSYFTKRSINEVIYALNNGSKTSFKVNKLKGTIYEVYKKINKIKDDDLYYNPEQAEYWYEGAILNNTYE